MASPVKMYQQEMHRNLGFFATWLPGDRLEIGDVGILEGGRFRKQNSLSELRINYVLGLEGSPQNLQYTSTAGTGLKLLADKNGEDSESSSAKIEIEFNRHGAFLFHASNCRNIRIENSFELADAILGVYENRAWDPQWLVIEAAHVAECATIIVCEDTSAGLVLSARASRSLGTIPLADPAVRLSIAFSKGKMTQVVAGHDLRPLYSCLRLKESWLSDPKVLPVRGARDATQLPFTRPGVSELLES